MISISYTQSSCPNGYEACISVTNKCGDPLYLHRWPVYDGDDEWNPTSSTSIQNDETVVLDISLWKDVSGSRLIAWFADPVTETSINRLWDKDKVEITWCEYGTTNRMCYNPTSIDYLGLPVSIGPKNPSDCSSIEPTGYMDITRAQIKSTCPTIYIESGVSTFGICQSPFNLCIWEDSTDAICSHFDSILVDCKAGGQCDSSATTMDVYQCLNTMWNNRPWCAALNRGLYYQQVAGTDDQSDSSTFYKNTPYNEYASWIHKTGARTYAFPTDDTGDESASGYADCTTNYLEVIWCPGEDGNATPSPVDATCGYVPTTCSGHISWAVTDGRVSNPEWYPNFYDVTGVQLSSTTIEDMTLYFYCEGTNPNGDCDGLLLPCSRSCSGSTPSPVTPAPITPVTLSPVTPAPITSTPSPVTSTLSSIFGVNIYSTDNTFDISMIEDLITNKNIYHFRSFASWGRTAEVTDLLNTYSSLGTSLLLNIGYEEDPDTYSTLFNSYNFKISIQIDSCSWPHCTNPTEGGFCQGNYNVDTYVARLNTFDSTFSTDIEFIIPWQNSNAASQCDYESVLQAAYSIQNDNGRKFSLSGTWYNFFFGPNIGAGKFPSDSIDNLADSAQTDANNYANGLVLGLRVAETAWPDQCDDGINKEYGDASLDNLCIYYNEAIKYIPNGDINEDVLIYWWIVDDRDVGDGCGYGAWGLYDDNGDFKCGDSTPSPVPVTPAPVDTTDCGYVPTACSGHISWAVTDGKATNPEWYPNFYDITGVQLSSANQEDMTLYFYCEDTNPNGDCNSLQIPCSRSCGDSTPSPVTSAPVTSAPVTPSPITPAPVTPAPIDTKDCGYIPEDCSGHINWATYDGSKNHQDWYPNFYDITGVQLSSATEEDMTLYFYCTNTNPEGDCNGLQLPCSRSCGTVYITTVPTTAPKTVESELPSELGFCLSVGLQSSPLSDSEVAAITSNSPLNGVKYYKFYGHSMDHDVASTIISESSISSNIQFIIAILPAKVDNLSNDDIQTLLDEWDDLKSYIYCISLGNEPSLNSEMTFSLLPSKLKMVYEYLETQTGWNNIKVSIPFSQNIFDVSYPVEDSAFKDDYISDINSIIQVYIDYSSIFSINIYPFFTVPYVDDSLLDYCLGEESAEGEYKSMLESQYHGTYYAMNDAYNNNNIEIVITETGWSSYSSDSTFDHATSSNANKYISNTLRQMEDSSSKLYNKRIYFFELFDEDLKSGGDYEQYFGFHDTSGSMKYSQLTDSSFSSNNNDSEMVGSLELPVFIGIVVGLLFCCLVLIIILIYCVYRERKQNKKHIPTNNDDVNAKSDKTTLNQMNSGYDMDDIDLDVSVEKAMINDQWNNNFLYVFIRF